MTARLSLPLMLCALIMLETASVVLADGEILGFAVVSEVPKDFPVASAQLKR